MTFHWTSVSDWDGAQSDSQVVHESVANTDHNNGGDIKQGYSAASPFLDASMVAYYPCHEDSGTTAYDFSGSNNGTINGATVNVTGILGTSAYSFDGTDDYVDVGSVYGTGDPLWFACWFKLDSHTKCSIFDQYQSWTLIYNRNGNNNMNLATYGNNTTFSMSINTGTWYHLAAQWDRANSTADFWLDSTNSSTSYSDGLDSSSGNCTFGSGWDGSQAVNFFPGDMADVRFGEGTALTNSDVQTLYDVVNTSGSLTTGKKTS